MSTPQPPPYDPLLLRKILDCAPGIIYVIDAQMRYLQWNRQLEELVGYSAQELAAMHPSDLIPPEDNPLVLSAIAQVLGGGTVALEARLVRKDGLVFPIFFRAVPMTFEGQPYVVGSGIDLRDLRSAQEDLQRSEARYRSIVESGFVGVLALGDDFCVRFCNRPLAELLELPIDEMVGSDFRQFIDEKSRDEVNDVYTDFQNGRAYPSTLRIHVQTSLGNRRYFQVNLSPALNHSGAREIVVHVNDQTHRLESDAQRKKYESALEKAARVASIGVVAGGITHEINQPLSALMLRAETLKHLLGGGGGDPVMLQTGLQDIVRDAERISEIVQHMRAYWVDSQEAGGEQMADLNTAIISATGFVQQRVLGADVNMEIDLHPGALMVRCASIRLEQIIINLINNAVNAFRQEGWQGSRTVRLSTRRKGGTLVEVEVADNGPGLPTDNTAKLFDPLYTTNAELGGTGLGLAIVKMFAEQAGGKVHAMNREIGGALFVVTLLSAPEEF